ncbi:glycosyltransferase family 4 protein [Chloroflexota bacterium]
MSKHKLKRRKPNVAVVTLPSSNVVVEIKLVTFMKVLEPLAGKICAITGRYPDEPGGKIHIIRVKAFTPGTQLLPRIVRFLLAQPKIVFHLLRISRSIDVVIFFIGGMTYLLPILVAKLLRKKVVLSATGLDSKSHRQIYDKIPFGLGKTIPYFVFRVLEGINLLLVDQIAVESASTADFLGLKRYQKKIVVNGGLYINTDLFTIRKRIAQRRNLVGYIGRFSGEKGVLNFVRAIPLLTKAPDDTKFIINGDGRQYNQVKNELEINHLQNKVNLRGWLLHDDELPDHLNELKLLVLPSYTEGVPVIVQEAMACGTPVLATPVGGVPDLIHDEETGFVLENNSPECIARNILRALEHPELEDIVQNARHLIEQEYTYQPIVEKCRHALDELWNIKKSAG